MGRAVERGSGILEISILNEGQKAMRTLTTPKRQVEELQQVPESQRRTWRTTSPHGVILTTIGPDQTVKQEFRTGEGYLVCRVRAYDGNGNLVLKETGIISPGRIEKPWLVDQGTFWLNQTRRFLVADQSKKQPEIIPQPISVSPPAKLF